MLAKHNGDCSSTTPLSTHVCSSRLPENFRLPHDLAVAVDVDDALTAEAANQRFAVRHALSVIRALDAAFPQFFAFGVALDEPAAIVFNAHVTIAVHSLDTLPVGDAVLHGQGERPHHLALAVELVQVALPRKDHAAAVGSPVH